MRRASRAGAEAFQGRLKLLCGHDWASEEQASPEQSEGQLDDSQGWHPFPFVGLCRRK